MSYGHNSTVFRVLFPKFSTGQKKIAPTGWHGWHVFATLVQIVGDEYGLLVVPPGLVGDTFQFGKCPVFLQTEGKKRVEEGEPWAGALFSGAA